MAQGLATQAASELGWDQVEVRSAGIAAFPGAPVSGGALRVSASHGIDLSSHRSSYLTKEVVDWADVILGMSPHHVIAAERLGGEGKTRLITEFEIPERSGGAILSQGVLDPIGGDDALYEETFQQLKRLTERALQSLAAERSR
jgi:protein-tyrosine-phosphatase